MKKLVSLLLVFALIACMFVGCAKDDDVNSEDYLQEKLNTTLYVGC